RAAESLDVGAADAGVADAEQRLTGRRPRGGGLDELDGARCCDVDGSHERPPRTSGTGAVGMATRISSIPYIAALGASSGIWRTIASSLLMNIPGVDRARRDDPFGIGAEHDVVWSPSDPRPRGVPCPRSPSRPAAPSWPMPWPRTARACRTRA